MTQASTPILTSLLDTDAYKLHMQQAVYHHYKSVTVEAEFRCRSDDKLGQYAKEIGEQIQMMSELSLTEEEAGYLSALPFFQADYLTWLRGYRFNPSQVHLSQSSSGDLHIRLVGSWLDVILWEVPLLAVISETVHKYRSPEASEHMALEKLSAKLEAFKADSADIDLSAYKLLDFGTRRRFSKRVQFSIVEYLKNNFPYLSGTSNYLLAKQLNLTPAGTQAHEWFQAHQQICPVLANSQRAALQAWLDEYPNHLGIALTDCIAMDAFLRDFGPQFASRYQGLRHDSGDPIEWGEKALAHYTSLNIDPMTKTLVFSDNLDLDKSLNIYRHFSQRTQLVFGIGTRLTCDIPNVRPLNIVIKLTKCNGKPVAKLSDSPGKTICQDPAFVRALRKAFDLPLVKKTG